MKKDKNTENMTDAQKQIYYVTKIASVDVNQWKNAIGCLLGLTMMAPKFIIPDQNYFEILNALGVSISLYCGLTTFVDQSIYKNAKKHLKELNEELEDYYYDEIDEEIEEERGR